MTTGTLHSFDHWIDNKRSHIGHPSKDYTSIPSKVADQVKNRIAYASFGNEGLTATANAHGRLIQITRYFGDEQEKFGNPSGFVCVEFAEMPHPYSVVSRLARLESHIKSSKNGMHFGIKGNDDDSPWRVRTSIPEMQFLRDRWPCFITATQVFEVNIEYRIHKDTVYQIYTYKKNPKASDIPPLPQLTIDVKPLFRHLDFSREPSGIDQDSEYVYVRERNKENEVLRIRKEAKRNENGIVQTTTSLCLSLFINGRAQKFSGNDRTSTVYTIDPPDSSELRKNEDIQIALAYTLGEISLENEDVNNIKPLSFIDPWKILEESEVEFKEPSFVNDAHLNFALRRNLEHILSVCSIPVATSSITATPPVVDEASDKIPLIALTCGDVSGHRISTAASFYAFQVLLQALKHFSKEAKKSCKSPKPPCQSYDCSAVSQNPCKNYDCYMHSRIWKVCYGHVKWLYTNLQLDKDKKSICPHYWASGEVIEGWEGHPFLRGKSLADTPFHIIKAAEFYKIAGKKEIEEEVADGIRPIIKNWIEKLDERNKQGKYAFPHFREEPTHIFYFSDHVMIWRGIKSVEDLGMVQELKPNPDQGRKLSYTSAKIRMNILRRFTTKNKQSNQRMLTVLRSPPETKFFLQLEDTVLFDAVDLGLFEKSTTSSNNNMWNNKIHIWKSMINFQMDQLGNEAIDWIHPIQFALAMMISAKNGGIDSKSEVVMIDMFKYSKSILLGSSSRNGLFPGQLDENKEPLLFSEELKSEDYWYTTFELPYILWTYQMPYGPYPPLPQLSTTSETALNTQYQENLMITKNIPFDNIIDTRNIVEITDEWMYNEPKFFGHEDCNLESSVKKFLKEDGKDSHAQVTQVMRKIYGNNAQTFDGKVEGYFIDVPKSKEPINAPKSKEPSDAPRSKEPSDAPRSKALLEKKKHTTESISKNSDMYEPLKKGRLPEKAKKRLFHFYRPNPGTALICYLLSSEQDEISTFFQRHALYDKYFFDEITPLLNTWKTEFHLSFYRITDKSSPSKTPGISPSDEIEFPHSYQQDQSKWISRAVMSFRFDGDVFDRYWTCHFFECEPQRAGKKKEDSDSGKKKEDPDSGKKKEDSDSLCVPDLMENKSSKGDPWKQRQVLELLIFDEILREMLKCTEDILENVKCESLRNPKNQSASAQTVSLTSPLSDPLDLFREINGGVFESTTQLWRKLHHILQVVEDDLSKNLTKISHWKDRQAGREPNRPRWTLKDERGYRSAISKLLASNDQKIFELERCYADIESFKMLLSKRLDITREDLDLRRANDLRLFTYVTVVFLPISFATGVFSMSNAPTTGLVGSMATTATVALLVTVVALFNAKTLEAYLAQPLLSIFRRVIYNPIISPCVYFLARYLFFPLHNSLPDNILPQGYVKSFLERLMKIGPISEARKNFFGRQEKSEKKSAASDLEKGTLEINQGGTSQPPSTQTSTRAQSEETQRVKASLERSRPSCHSSKTAVPSD